MLRFPLITTYRAIHRKKRVCIERGAFDNRLGACVMYLAHGNGDCDCGVGDGNGCANVAEASDGYF